MSHPLAHTTPYRYVSTPHQPTADGGGHSAVKDERWYRSPDSHDHRARVTCECGAQFTADGDGAYFMHASHAKAANTLPTQPNPRTEG